MAYSELIKNFNDIRAYMKDFFIYGFKTREEYEQKSARSYDNERRRIQSYLGDLVSFRQTPYGKNMFISMDSRSVTHNPLYRAFKAKSFTNKDITLHFIVMDILKGGESYTNQELLEKIEDDYLSHFENPISFDESTLRKKLKEYEQLGIVQSFKEGRVVKYCIQEDEVDLKKFKTAVRFFAEENILGVVGSYLEDKEGMGDEEFLQFKNRYIMNAYDTEIIYSLLTAIREKRKVEVVNYSRRTNETKTWKVIPIKIYMSAREGRSYLICKRKPHTQLLSYRIDYIQKVTLLDKEENYDEALADYKIRSKHIWGVVCSYDGKYEHIELDIHVAPGEDYIIRRLRRERRCGTVTKVNADTYRLVADVMDSFEMVPWIRTFYGRIKRVKCSNPEVVEQLKQDILKMSMSYEVME